MNKKNYTYIAVDVSKETLYVHTCECSYEVSYDARWSSPEKMDTHLV